MSEIFKTQAIELKKSVSNFCSSSGEKIVQEMNKNSALMLHWLNFLQGCKKTGVADELLEGALSSIKEATACAALGMIRPCIFSMRMHIDLIFAWLYFKDHSVEWNTLNSTGDGFKLKKDILEYLTLNFSGFRARLSLLNEVAQRANEDIYRLLSAHIHAQSAVVLPVGGDLSDVVQPSELVFQCPKLWLEVCEYVSDILVSVYSSNWIALPALIQSSVESRLNLKKNQKKRFFDGA